MQVTPGDASGTALTKAHLAETEIIVRWTAEDAAHEDHFLARKMNPWRDILPPGMDKALQGATPGTSIRETSIPGKLLPGHRPRKIATIPRDCFRPFKLRGHLVTPQPGRFYPFPLLNSHPGIRTADVRPAFRVLAASDKEITVDFNHPLANYELDVEMRVLRVFPKAGVIRNSLPDWIADICEDGPGMQQHAPGLATDFHTPEANQRPDNTPDPEFYATARQHPHLDSTASTHLESLYSTLLTPDAQILDLMAGRFSHLPATPSAHITGLGLGQADLDANPALTTRTQHDLNAHPHLPHPDNHFDLIISSLSYEYLTNPKAVLAEAHRTLRPGGTIAIAFSNRWFPEKATLLWTILHDFERLALTLDHLKQTGFTNLTTTTHRNWPRPTDDPHIAETLLSDPLFLATGRKN